MKNFLQRYNNDSNPVQSFFGDAFDNYFRPLFFDEKFDSMRTDIKETDNGYQLDVELPGFSKEDIAVDYENDYVTIRAEKKEKSEDGKKSNYIRKERSVSCQRSYYVGSVEENDIKAKYENGVLTVSLPKEEQKKPEKKGINID